MTCNLDEGAGDLRPLGYERVIFSVVDPTRKRIEGVVENSDDPEHMALRRISYSLDDQTQAGHVWVFREKRALRGRDASTDEIFNTRAARNVNAQGIAIVPLLDPAERVIGTISIERCDKIVPTEEEVEDLIQFGASYPVC